MIWRALALLMAFSCVACWQQQGHRPQLGPAHTWQLALDYRERGDLIAAEQLLERLRSEHSASLYGVLATLELRTWSPEVVADAHVGALGAQRARVPVPTCESR